MDEGQEDDMHFMKALAKSLLKLRAEIYWEWYLPIFRPTLYRIHCEAIQTLLRDVGYVDRADSQNREKTRSDCRR